MSTASSLHVPGDVSGVESFALMKEVRNVRLGGSSKVTAEQKSVDKLDNSSHQQTVSEDAACFGSNRRGSGMKIARHGRKHFNAGHEETKVSAADEDLSRLSCEETKRWLLKKAKQQLEQVEKRLMAIRSKQYNASCEAKTSKESLPDQSTALAAKVNVDGAENFSRSASSTAHRGTSENYNGHQNQAARLSRKTNNLSSLSPTEPEKFQQFSCSSGSDRYSPGNSDNEEILDSIPYLRSLPGNSSHFSKISFMSSSAGCGDLSGISGWHTSNLSQELDELYGGLQCNEAVKPVAGKLSKYSSRDNYVDANADSLDNLVHELNEVLINPSMQLHLGCLSVETQYDSQFVDSMEVKRVHLEAVLNWRKQKPLDLLLTGCLREIPVEFPLALPSVVNDLITTELFLELQQELTCLLRDGDDVEAVEKLAESMLDEFTQCSAAMTQTLTNSSNDKYRHLFVDEECESSHSMAPSPSYDNTSGLVSLLKEQLKGIWAGVSGRDYEANPERKFIRGLTYADAACQKFDFDSFSVEKLDLDSLSNSCMLNSSASNGAGYVETGEDSRPIGEKRKYSENSDLNENLVDMASTSVKISHNFCKSDGMDSYTSVAELKRKSHRSDKHKKSKKKHKQERRGKRSIRHHDHGDFDDIMSDLQTLVANNVEPDELFAAGSNVLKRSEFWQLDQKETDFHQENSSTSAYFSPADDDEADCSAGKRHKGPSHLSEKGSSTEMVVSTCMNKFQTDAIAQLHSIFGDNFQASWQRDSAVFPFIRYDRYCPLALASMENAAYISPHRVEYESFDQLCDRELPEHRLSAGHIPLLQSMKLVADRGKLQNDEDATATANRSSSRTNSNIETDQLIHHEAPSSPVLQPSALEQTAPEAFSFSLIPTMSNHAIAPTNKKRQRSVDEKTVHHSQHPSAGQSASQPAQSAACPRFMQTFRQSQIAKRRNLRESNSSEQSELMLQAATALFRPHQAAGDTDVEDPVGSRALLENFDFDCRVDSEPLTVASSSSSSAVDVRVAGERNVHPPRLSSLTIPVAAGGVDANSDMFADAIKQQFQQMQQTISSLIAAPPPADGGRGPDVQHSSTLTHLPAPLAVQRTIMPQYAPVLPVNQATSVQPKFPATIPLPSSQRPLPIPVPPVQSPIFPQGSALWTAGLPMPVGPLQLTAATPMGSSWLNAPPGTVISSTALNGMNSASAVASGTNARDDALVKETALGVSAIAALQLRKVDEYEKFGATDWNRAEDALSKLVGDFASYSGSARNLRIFVFNRERKDCQLAEELLIRTGAKMFDPYNVVLLRATMQTECNVLVHSDDLSSVHLIPNLLRLKRDLRVTFHSFTTLHDISRHQLTMLFPRAGLVVMDTATLLNNSPVTLEKICQFMMKQTTEKAAAWMLMLTPSAVSILDDRGPRNDEAQEDVCLIDIVYRFRSLGIISILPNEMCPAKMSSADYLYCCRTLQLQHVTKYRHFLFVSDVPKETVNIKSFTDSGIDVLNVLEFSRGFVGCSTIAKSVDSVDEEYSLAAVSEAYNDCSLSTGAEIIMNKWSVPFSSSTANVAK